MLRYVNVLELDAIRQEKTTLVVVVDGDERLEWHMKAMMQ